MKQLSHLHIETGPGGWLKAFWRREGGADNVIFARFRPPRTRRQEWAIIGLQASKDSSPPWLSTGLLDDVPRDRIVRAVMASDVFREGLLSGIDHETPSDLDSAFRRVYKETPRIVLERPPRSQLDEAHFRRVALAYRRAIAAGLPPLKTMSDDANIPQGTIARWVARARELKFLPPAEPGKVST